MQTLADRALKVKLTIHRPTTTRKDTQRTSSLQQQEQDTGLRVLSTIFVDKHGPVRQMLAHLNTIYDYHRVHTLPWMDAGPRLLPVALFQEYTKTVQTMRDALDGMKRTHLPHYDALVREDMLRRGANAKPSDYPTRDECDQQLSVSVRVEPLPKVQHFLFDIGQEAREQFEQEQRRAFVQAQNDALDRVLKPVGQLLAKLDAYTGSPGERFHASLITNVQDGVAVARKLVFDPSPDLLEEFARIEHVATQAAQRVELLKDSAPLRAQMAEALGTVARNISTFNQEAA